MRIKAMQHAAVLGVFLIMAACSASEETPVEQTHIIRPVRTQRVFTGSGSRVRSFSGVARAGVETSLSFKVAGTVNQLNVDVGDRVRAGSVIAVLDPRDYELQVEDAVAALAQARAQERNASADYERVRGLYENGNASVADLDASRAAAESATARVSSAQKRVEFARLQVAYTMLTSPVDGAVAEVPVELNENVTAGGAVVVLNSGSVPEVEIAVPESLIARVRDGDRATVRFDSLGGEAFGATVSEVGVAPTRPATTFPVALTLDRADSRILPGMAAEADFRFSDGTGSGQIVAPAQAVGSDDNGTFVWVIEPRENGLAVAHRRDVSVGDLVSSGLVMRSGLDDSELIATAGIASLSEGMTVRLIDQE